MRTDTEVKKMFLISYERAVTDPIKVAELIIRIAG